MIGLSRIYLAVHFPIDVITGWLIGSILLFIMLRLEKPFMNWINQFSAVTQIGLFFLGTLVFLAIWYSIRFALSGFQTPPQWLAMAAAQFPQVNEMNPLSPKGIISDMGALFGFGVGGIIINSLGGFKTRGNLFQYFLRAILGIIGVIIIWYGLEKVFPRNTDFISYALRYIRYALITIWVAAIAPLFFRIIKIAQAE